MRSLAWLVALGACTASSAPRGGVATVPPVSEPPRDTDDSFRPSYGHAELRRALVDERLAANAADRRVHELADRGDEEQLRLATADLAVRRRFVASLEACEATGATCTPRLDDPPWSYDAIANIDPKLDTKLRFDLDSWRLVAGELHGRACACRTLTCVDSMYAAIDRLETRPMPDVQGDEAASLSITRARECLNRLRRAPRAIAGE